MTHAEMKKNIQDSIQYLDWYFEESDGMADKTAAKHWDLLKHVINAFLAIVDKNDEIDKKAKW